MLRAIRRLLSDVQNRRRTKQAAQSDLRVKLIALALARAADYSVLGHQR